MGSRDEAGRGRCWLEEVEQREPRRNPRTSESRLGFRDVDLNAVRPLGGRVLSERSSSFGCHEASAGFLPLAVLKVQRTLTHDAPAPPGRPLCHGWEPLPLLQGAERENVFKKKKKKGLFVFIRSDCVWLHLVVKIMYYKKRMSKICSFCRRQMENCLENHLQAI